ncbi:MAG: Gfo/Idh/MocA family oxidoreductase [Chitinophagaceae bacterium]|nr:MAG: Gfo/Idh/MocA family oxidoreductase [Chitinophagaceae bacterium]
MKTRRSFIQTVAAPILALPLLDNEIREKLLADIPYDGPVLKVALMGLGGYATIVANAMQSCTKAKITGLISGTPSKLTAWQSKYGVDPKNCYTYQDFDAIKNNKDIDIVYVITPNGLHKDQVIRVAKAGKHVICEKPMAINAAEGKQMVDACAKAGVKLFVGYRLHFEATTLEVIRLRKAGEFGSIRFFQGLSGFKIGDPTQWRLDKKLAGGGSMMDIGIYSINGARYMVGEEPVWVTAQETKTDPVKFKEGVDETITFQMGFPSGAIASCLSTYAMNHLDRFFLDGEKGFAEMLPSTGYGPIKGKTNNGEITQPHVTHQAKQMDELAEIIFSAKQPVVPVDGGEGLKDLRIIDAIFEAVRTGKKVMI